MEERRKLDMDELGRSSIEDFKLSPKIPVVLVLDNVRSLHNVGAAFRTCDAFSVSKIYLTGITGTPPHREINKAALGATESVDWEYTESISELLTNLKLAGVEIVTVEQTTNSIPLQNFVANHQKKYCLIFGNEVEGVQQKALSLSDFTLEIPQSGTKHSLNISVCTGIVLWHLYQQLAL